MLKNNYDVLISFGVFCKLNVLMAPINMGECSLGNWIYPRYIDFISCILYIACFEGPKREGRMFIRSTLFHSINTGLRITGTSNPVKWNDPEHCISFPWSEKVLKWAPSNSSVAPRVRVPLRPIYFLGAHICSDRNFFTTHLLSFVGQSLPRLR